MYGPVWPVWSRMVHMVHMDQYGPVFPQMVPFGLVWPHLTPHGHIWSHLVPYCPVCSSMVLFGPVWYCMIPYMALYCPVWPWMAPYVSWGYLCLPLFNSWTSAQILCLLIIERVKCRLHNICVCRCWWGQFSGGWDFRYCIGQSGISPGNSWRYRRQSSHFQSEHLCLNYHTIYESHLEGLGLCMDSGFLLCDNQPRPAMKVRKLAIMFDKCDLVYMFVFMSLCTY